MAMFRKELGADSFNRGVNDTIFPLERRPGEATTQRNVMIGPDGWPRKIGGRLSIKDDFAHDITGIFLPPERIALTRLTDDNNKLYFSYNGSPFTAEVATGPYYNYTDLMGALRSAMAAACGHSISAGYQGYSAIGGNLPNYRCYVQKPDGVTLYLLWYDDLTTLPLEIFGAAFGSDCTDVTGMISGKPYWISEWEVRFEPDAVMLWSEKGETGGVVMTTSGLYGAAGTQFVAATDANQLASDQRPAGAWNQDKFYFNNGRRNYLIRDYMLKMLAKNSDNPRPYSSSAIAALTYNNFTTGGNTIYLDHTRRAAKLYATSASYKTDYYQSGYLSLKMYRDAAAWEFKVTISAWIPELQYKKVLKVLTHDDLATSTTVITWTDIDYFKAGRNTGDPARGQVDDYILIEYEQNDPDATGKVYIDGKTNAGYNSYSAYIDSNGIWQAVTTWLPYMVEKQSTAAAGGFYCITLENEEGFETELDDWEYQVFYNCIKFNAPSGVDIRYINLYKSITGVSADAAVFYLQASIDYRLWDGGDTMTVYLCHNDTWLQTQPEANMSSRTSQMLYKQAVWFDGYLWVCGDPAYPNRVFWCDEQDGITAPEKWAPASRNIPFGSSSEIVTGIAAGLDRLIVFKENAYCFMAVSGDSYAIIDTSDDGVGSKTGYSCVHVFSNQGSVFYFQGGDGHFYATDGVKLYYLSKGNERAENARLAEFVATLNMAALDRTFAIFDPNNQEVKWSVCTGSNTTPNITVIYSIPNNAFYFQDAAASFWTLDKINDSYEGEVLVMGCAGTGTFYDRMADTDLGAVMTAEARWDFDLGKDTTDKIWYALHWWLGSKTSDQQALIESYLNDSATASVSKAVDLDDPPAKQRMGLTGMSARLGIAFKATASYPAVGARLGRVVIEGSEQEDLVL